MFSNEQRSFIDLLLSFLYSWSKKRTAWWRLKTQETQVNWPLKMEVSKWFVLIVILIFICMSLVVDKLVHSCEILVHVHFVENWVVTKLACFDISCFHPPTNALRCQDFKSSQVTCSAGQFANWCFSFAAK